MANNEEFMRKHLKNLSDKRLGAQSICTRNPEAKLGRRLRAAGVDPRLISKILSGPSSQPTQK